MLTRGRLAVVRTPDHIPTSILCEGARRTLSCVCMKEQLQNRKWRLHDPPFTTTTNKKKCAPTVWKPDGATTSRTSHCRLPNWLRIFRSTVVAKVLPHRIHGVLRSLVVFTSTLIILGALHACGDPNHFGSGCPMQFAHSAPSCVFCGRCGTQRQNTADAFCKFCGRLF